MTVKFQQTSLIKAAIATAGVVIVFAFAGGCRRQPAPPAPSSPPPAATEPVATTAPAAAAVPSIRYHYLDVVRANYSDFPATQPLGDLLDLPEAAHLRFTEPIYLAPPPQSEMWITRPDAPPMQRVLQDAVDPQSEVDAHVIGRRIEFVDWMPDAAGNWTPCLVCRGDDGGDEVISAAVTHPLKMHGSARWDLAFAWNDKVVVPTAGGICIADLASGQEESEFNFWSPTTAPSAATAPVASATAPLALPDMDGILAWLPWDPHLPGSGQAARFVDGKWTALTANMGWPGRLIHAVPLLDGSALQLLAGDDGSVKLTTATLQNVAVDETKIASLVDQLSDAEEQKRTDAYEQLTRYGPGIWPILQKLAPDQPPEAAMRLDELLKDKIEPTLGGMKLLGQKSMTVAARLGDGGSVFYIPDGVSIPEPGGEPTVESPAWISVRPGRAIELLPIALTADLKPGESRIWAFGDEWIVSTDVRGPRRFIGNGLVTLLRSDESAFDELIGIDRRGRWLFKKSGGEGGFLVIDPTLPDPTPRLPAWEFATAQAVGWDKDDWPVVKRGSAYALTETDWRLLGATEKMLGASDVKPVTSATTQATQPPILVTADGTRYFDGQSTLRVVDRADHQTIWPLPALANGQGAVRLLRTSDGRLYLFNEPGRVLRIRPTPGKSEPFAIEATFTHSVPNTDRPTRIWLDPAGRIDVEWESHLTILFPSGYIPPRIAEKMQTDDSGGQ
jgi:hypothetical protein